MVDWSADAFVFGLVAAVTLVALGLIVGGVYVVERTTWAVLGVASIICGTGFVVLEVVIYLCLRGLARM